jgi:hypothetical protein
MNKKLYAQLLLAILIGNNVVAETDGFFNRVGRTLNGNTPAVMTASTAPVERISFSDAKDLKKQMRDISKNVSGLSVQKRDEVKTKVTKLADLVKKNQVAGKKGKVKKSKKQ